jgi:hypothetical protein
MPLRYFVLMITGLLPVLVVACAGESAPKVDTVATAVAQAASDLLTQTAAAASPTSPPPTLTATPSPTAAPSPTETPEFRRPQTVTFASCGLGGPEPAYEHETSVAKGKGVELLGIGSIAGYYVIRDPYFHRPCWMRATDLKIFPGTDLSQYPVMTPGIPQAGQ